MRASMVFSILMSRARVGGWASRPLSITHTRVLGHRVAQRLIHAAAPVPYISRLADETASSEPRLRLLNSLTQRADPFVPIDARLVKWYICGPTVYDSAHVGHARNYVAFDIVRRVLRDYFGFDLLYVMNITDIDDKIILRAHRNHLEASLRALAGADGVDAARRAAERVLEAAKPSLAELMEAQRQLCDAADAAALGGVTPCDVHAAFLELTAHFEKEFFDDMAALNVLPPDAVTRVSDYVPEVVAYIEKIMANGYCYESNGSVYFDTAAFRASGKPYGKLDPTKVGAEEGKSVRELLDEGEGALSADGGADKRQPADFVLWKASKRGEPAWPSPWGAGRPGWHIECSAMASDLLGDAVDLNAGGSDLKFPHHENQLAQAEAHFDCCAWVNYFLHSGHLKIEGLKMSKSLKNFITIREALERDSARQIRLMFLLQAWDKPMDYSDQTIDDAKAKEKRLESFFGMVKAVLRDAWLSKPTSWTPLERALSERLLVLQAETHGCLTDNFDTAGAMASLLSITDEAFTYKMKVEKEGRSPDALLLKRAAMYVTKLLRIFGVATQDDFGFPLSAGGGSYEADVAPFVETIVRFRDEVRTHAKASTPPQSSLLAMCDHLRDYKMVDLGVKVMDGDGAGAWELADASKLRKERELKEQEQADRAAEKVGNKLAVKLEEYSKAVVASMPPAQMVRQPQFATQYGGFDAQGKPTTDASGEALSKAAAKNLDKLWQKQQKEHEKYLESLKKTPELLSNLKTELEARRVEAEKLVGKDSVLSDQMRDKLKLTLDKVASSVPVDME